MQSRAYAYMGIALYEAVRPGMSNYNSIANQLNRNFDLPSMADSEYHWPLAANAALAEVMRGLWGGCDQQRDRQHGRDRRDGGGVRGAIDARSAGRPRAVDRLRPRGLGRRLRGAGN